MPVRQLTPQELYRQGLIQKDYQKQAAQHYADTLKLKQQRINAATTNASANMLNATQSKELANLRANTSLETANIGADNAIANRILVNKNNLAVQGLMKNREHNQAAYSLVKTALQSGNIADLNTIGDVYNKSDAAIQPGMFKPAVAPAHYTMTPQKNSVDLQGHPTGIQQLGGAFNTASGVFTPFTPFTSDQSMTRSIKPGASSGVGPAVQQTGGASGTWDTANTVSPEVQRILDQVKSLDDQDTMRAKLIRERQLRKDYPTISTKQLKALIGQ